ncbi:MAG: PQQ-dependent sugar dehydrogenase [Actinomycetota bacterium]
MARHLGFRRLTIAALAVLAACGGDGTATPAAPPETTVPLEERVEFIKANEPCSPPPDHAIAAPDGSAPIELEVATEVPDPTTIAFAPDGRAYIGQRTGEIHLWTGAGVPVVALDLSSRTAAENDQGLLGMEVSPDGQWLYVNHTLDTGPSRIIAFPIVEGIPREEGAAAILTVDQPSRLHNGGDLAFGPDGLLYASFGDGGGLGDRFYNGQNLTTALGAIIRIDPRPGDSPAFEIPDDNPFVGVPGAEPLNWVNGIRNPFRFSFDGEGRMWLADLGQQCIEEINVLTPAEAGANLGWNVWEGDEPFVGELADGQTHRSPDFSYWHGQGWCAVIGGHVYDGTALPDLVGSYVFTDLCRGEIVVAATDFSEVRSTGVMVERPVDISVDADGELYVVSASGQIHRIVPAG